MSASTHSSLLSLVSSGLVSCPFLRSCAVLSAALCARRIVVCGAAHRTATNCCCPRDSDRSCHLPPGTDTPWNLPTRVPQHPRSSTRNQRAVSFLRSACVLPLFLPPRHCQLASNSVSPPSLQAVPCHCRKLQATLDSSPRTQPAALFSLLNVLIRKANN